NAPPDGSPGRCGQAPARFDLKMPKSNVIKAEGSMVAGERAMCRKRAATLWYCLAALQLFGCVAGVSGGSKETTAPAAVANDWTPPGFSPSGAAEQAAILVVLPGAGAFASDPALWTREGFAIVTPPPTALYQLAAAEEAALAQELASARRLADAQIWLLGPS